MISENAGILESVKDCLDMLVKRQRNQYITENVEYVMMQSK